MKIKDRDLNESKMFPMMLVTTTFNTLIEKFSFLLRLPIQQVLQF